MESEFRTGRYHDGDQHNTCLYRMGHKRVHITYVASTGIVHRAEPMEEARQIEPLTFKGGDYPLDRMIRRYLRIGRMLGITESAKAELTRAVASG